MNRQQNLWVGVVFALNVACGAKTFEPIDENHSQPDDRQKPVRDSGVVAVTRADAGVATPTEAKPTPSATADAPIVSATFSDPLPGTTPTPNPTDLPTNGVEPTAESQDAGAPSVTPQACEALRPFDPNEVYIFGTLSEGACYLDAVAHWSAPNTALVGFGCYARSDEAVIRPTDGSLIFSETFDTTYVFKADGCVQAGTDFDYPSEPLANDEQVPFPCEDETTGYGFLVSPEGELALQCGEGWRRPDGTLILSNDIYPLAYDGVHFLLQDGVFDIETQTATPFVELPDASILAVRVADSGFWLAVATDTVTQRWFVDYLGVAKLDGEYPQPPAYVDYFSDARLSGSGDLFQTASDSREVFVDVIVRRSLSGESETVYTELDNPLVKLHISGLFTGP